MPTSTAKELGKVKLGAPIPVNDDDWSSGSETESDVTDSDVLPVPAEDQDEDDDGSESDRVFIPDAIKWAKYRNSKKDRPKGMGRIGWHYGVMWAGYLKSGWDTEEFYDCFDLDEEGRNQMMIDFWESVGRPMTTREGEMIEPRGRIGEYHEPSKDLMRRWISSARPRRSHKLFRKRFAKEKAIPRQKILKRESDYYWYKRITAQAEAAKANEGKRGEDGKLLQPQPQVGEGEAGPSTQTSRASSMSLDPSAPSSRAGSTHVIKVKVSSKGKEKAVDPALTALFDDEIVVTGDSPDKIKKKKKTQKNRDLEREVLDAEGDNQGKGKGKGKEKESDGIRNNASPVKSGESSLKGTPVGEGKEKKSKKRKHATTTGGASSPEKKTKTKSTSPSKAPRPFVPPTVKTIPPTPASTWNGPSTAASTRPRDTVSPTSPTSGPSHYKRPKPNQEPLFLDSAPSPADTFGSPLPGIFDSRPSSASTRIVNVKAETIDISSPPPTAVSMPGGSFSSDIIMLDPLLDEQARRSKSPMPTIASAPHTAVGASNDFDSTNVATVRKSKSKSPVPATALNSSLNPPTPPETAIRQPTISLDDQPQTAKSRSKSPAPPRTGEPTRASPSIVHAPAPLAPVNGVLAPPSLVSTHVEDPKGGKDAAPTALTSGPITAAEPTITPGAASTASPAPGLATLVSHPLSAPPAPTAEAAEPTKSPAAVEKELLPKATVVAHQGAKSPTTAPPPNAPATGVPSLPAASGVAATIPTESSLVVPTSSAAVPVVAPPVVTAAAPAATPQSPHSPIIEPPVPTFTSPRQVSRSPSEPMELDAEDPVATIPVIPVADLPLAETGDQGAGISPPRYVDALPTNEPTLPQPGDRLGAGPPSPRLPIKIPIPLSERPKYVQPSRIQYIAEVVDPEADALRRKAAARKASHASLPTKPAPLSLDPRASASTSHVRPPASAPVQPKGFGAANNGPSAAGYASRGAGPLADQKEAYKGVAPWDVRKRGGGPSAASYGGGVSPVNPYGGLSPHYGPPAGPSAMRTDQWRPAASPHTAYGGQSPAWAANTPMSAPGYLPTVGPPGWPQSGGQSPYPPVAVDPRGVSPSVMSPNPHLGFQPRPQAVDPRRASGGMTPVQSPMHPPASPGGGSGSVDTRRIDKLGRVVATLLPPSVDGEILQYNLMILTGAPQGQSAVGDKILGMVLGPQTKPTGTDMALDEVDMSLIGWQMRHGARLVQWAKVGNGDPNASAEWEKLKIKAQQKHRAWTSFTENPVQGSNNVSEHFAIILAHVKGVEGPVRQLGLGPWANVNEIGMTLLVLALPLDSGPSPLLPNPVQPTVDVKDEKPKIIKTAYPMHILASYDLTPDYFHSLRGTRAIKYPGQEMHFDILGSFIEHELREKGVIPHSEHIPPENVLFMNSKYTRAIKSETLARTVDRRTRYYAAGPALHLLPSQWGLKEIWTTGGLVTFSPTFVLRSPDKLAEIMKMVRVALNWAAYITPQLVQWVHASWKMPARCPDPSLAYQTFTQSLFFDNHLLSLSGSPAAAGGGLAVSTCPPLLSHGDRCARWMDWLQRISNERDYHALVNLCHDYGSFMSGKKSINLEHDRSQQEQDLELVDIERRQIEDLTAMRKRPHLLPYRRYIYVGDVSMTREQRGRIGAGIEFVEPDRFAAMFSGTQ